MRGWSRSRYDALLDRLAADELVGRAGSSAPIAAHLVAAVAALNRQSVRAALEALAAAHPGSAGQAVVRE